jgi:gephyrin
VNDLTSQISRGLEKSDVLVTTGGVSMGEFDLLKPVLERSLNATIHFGRVNLKPGKPTTFATTPQGKLIFCLPGNPVSALVTTTLFLVPCLRRCGGQEGLHDVIPVRVEHDIPLDSRPEFHRAVVRCNHGDWVATSTGFQRSSRVTSMVSANSLLMLPSRTKDRSVLRKGTIVQALYLPNIF